MTKTKCWKKDKEDSWNHKENIQEPSIVGGKYPSKRLEYSSFKNLHWVIIMDLKKDRTRFSPYFKSKPQALNFANKYMKKHDKC